jgi:putative selenate reductase
MRPIPFGVLVNWAREEYKKSGSVFGIREEKFYRAQGGAAVRLFGTAIAPPIGPAAGPHSQLAQNILAAYLAGSRFIELKTVQTMDGEELRKCVPRPCISAADEGYNVEWSTELTVQEAFDEYVKAWFLCHVFGKEFELDKEADGRAGSVIFNMSVGYSLEGIKSKKIDDYVNGMKDASKTAVWKDCRAWLMKHISEFKHFDKKDLDAVPGVISAGITLSTLHGCPREEIEKIAHYLIAEKGLHTYIKCNPTLLGYETARSILDGLGYGYVSFDDHHFKDDLQFGDAVDMIGRLIKTAEEKGLVFGVKLTNTFPVEIKSGELPGNEMYMSGRALFPLSINVAKKLAECFGGSLPISYSGGADFFNLKQILLTGIMPVTAATTILKPGAYERLKQLAFLAGQALEEAAMVNKNQPFPPSVDVKALASLAASAAFPHEAGDPYFRYAKDARYTRGSRKTSSALPLFDCAKAPCVGSPDDRKGGCPIKQRIPDYLAKIAEEKYDEAFAIIAVDNTAPSITGTICDHQCQKKCTRVDYEDSLRIRGAKRLAAEYSQERFIGAMRKPSLKTNKSVAVIGAGPAGIAAALYLRRNGVPVTVYEKRDKPYGAVQYLIPSFRISGDAVRRDYRMAENTGIEFIYNADADYSVSSLKKTFQFVVIATGAWKEGASPVKEGAEQVIDALKFLEDSKKSGLALDLGREVAVIGGGDVAMDCARAAVRNKGVEKVTVVYRRTREFMPAQRDEIRGALDDGVEFIELLAPESYKNGVLLCGEMALGDYGSDGRRNIAGTGGKKELRFDTVIGAVGARVDSIPFANNGISIGNNGFPVLNAANESSVERVYISGDCKAGASTVVKAIADSRVIAAGILSKLGLSADFDAAAGTHEDADLTILYARKGVLVPGSQDAGDAFRCLSCGRLCEICADVCPNRANTAIAVSGFAQPRQIVHIDRMCNECGNCSVFCPHAGDPCKDKFTVFLDEEGFNNSENTGFFKKKADVFTVRLEDKTVVDWEVGDGFKMTPPGASGKGGAGIPEKYALLIGAIAADYAYLL